MNNPKQAAAQMLGMQLNYDLPAGELKLTDKQIISFGSHTFKVMHTPGHLAFSIVFIVQKRMSSLLVTPCLREGIGRTDFPGG